MCNDVSLKACAFCKGTDQEIRVDQLEYNSWVGSIDCNSCELTVTPMYSEKSVELAKKAVIEQWNRRPE